MRLPNSKLGLGSAFLIPSNLRGKGVEIDSFSFVKGSNLKVQPKEQHISDYLQCDLS